MQSTKLFLCSFWHEVKRKYWKYLYKIILMRCTSWSPFWAWIMLGVGCMYNKSCTLNPILKWAKKPEPVFFSQAGLESSFLSYNRLILFHLCQWLHDFCAVVPGLSNSVFYICIFSHYYKTATAHRFTVVSRI